MELSVKGIKQVVEELPDIPDIYVLSPDFHLVVHQVFEKDKVYRGTVCDIKQIKAQKIYRIQKSSTGFSVCLSNAENRNEIKYDLKSKDILDAIAEVILSIDI